MDHPQGRVHGAEGEAPISAWKLHILLGLGAAALAAPTLAQDEHQRRLGAELVVMAGDVRRLTEAREPDRHLAGLRSRLAGALSSLPLLLRQAGASDGDRVQALRAALARADWRGLARELAELRRRHPLDLRHILPATPTPERLRLGEAIHRQACAGCHDAPPDPAAALPALSLFAQARSMSAEEFAARLLNGVRGTAEIAYRNPFSDIEIASLIAFYAGTGR